jgi:hypothetical protein
MKFTPDTTNVEFHKAVILEPIFCSNYTEYDNLIKLRIFELINTEKLCGCNLIKR